MKREKMLARLFGSFARGGYSWRKILTALAALLFAVASLGALVGAEELPLGYQAIIAAVFGFYFAKSRLRGERTERGTG